MAFFSFRSIPPFEYINNIDPSTEWRRDFPWWFQRVRGIAFTIVLQISAVTVSFLVEWPHLATAMIFLVGGVLALSLYWLRVSRLRRINSDEAIHRLTHDLRSRVYEITTAPNERIRKVRLEQFYQELADNIANYFRKRTDNPSFNCIVRIATADGENTAYDTVARSKGLADERSLRSQSESAGEGIAKQLLHQKKQGAYLVRDRLEATRNGIWKMTDNDTLDDIRSTLTVPINGWFMNEFDMLGILHLTVREGKLRRADWLPLKAISDLLGHVLSTIYPPPDTQVGQSGVNLVDGTGQPITSD